VDRVLCDDHDLPVDQAGAVVDSTACRIDHARRPPCGTGASIAGRLWVYWAADGAIWVTRSDTTVSAFEPAQRLTPPATRRTSGVCSVRAVAAARLLANVSNSRHDVATPAVMPR